MILFYASFFAGVIVMYEGIAQISPIYIRVARTLGASEVEIFRKVIVPLTVPHILTALRVALGVAWATLVASELIAAQQRARRADPERLDVLPARHHLCRHHLHRLHRAGHGPGRCARIARAACWSLAGTSASHEHAPASTHARAVRPRVASEFDTPQGHAAGGRRTSATTSTTASSSSSSGLPAAARPR